VKCEKLENTHFKFWILNFRLREVTEKNDFQFRKTNQNPKDQLSTANS